MGMAYYKFEFILCKASLNLQGLLSMVVLTPLSSRHCGTTALKNKFSHVSWFKYEVSLKDSCIEMLVPNATVVRGEAWRGDWMIRALTL